MLNMGSLSKKPDTRVSVKLSEHNVKLLKEYQEFMFTKYEIHITLPQLVDTAIGHGMAKLNDLSLDDHVQS